MRAGRLLSILLLLQAHGRMTAEQLAEALEVSVRTVYRDVEALGSAGVPVYAEPGRHGGYRLVDGYRTRLTGMSADEAQSLALAGLPGPAGQLGMAGALLTAELKIDASLPRELREPARRFRERFHVDTVGWYQTPDAVPHLEIFLDAVIDQRIVQATYRSWNAPRATVRELEPYGVVLKSGRWYCVARHSGRFRTYRIANLTKPETLDRQFERIEFDLAEHWQNYLADYERRRFTATATVRLTPAGLNRYLEGGGQIISSSHDSDDWWVALIPTESLDHATGELLRLGADAEVIAPDELRRNIAEITRVLADRYA